MIIASSLTACDPQLAMSGPARERHTIQICAEAVKHLQQCCPQYPSYVSCAVYDNDAPDFDDRQSRCLLEKDCAALSSAVANNQSVCKVKFQSNKCQ